MPREIRHRYEDPLDAIWIEVLRRVGYRLERSSDCFASLTPDGTLILGSDETLDEDDCLAQMIFHELCHSLVQGPDGLRRRDWGLCNETDRDVVREHATLRVQAHLARAHGLRRVLAPTTDFRAYYDALPDQPIPSASPGRDRASDDDNERLTSELARLALARAEDAPWAPHLADGLRATAQVVAAAAPFAHAPSLLAEIEETTSPKEGGPAESPQAPLASQDA